MVTRNENARGTLRIVTDATKETPAIFAERAVFGNVVQVAGLLELFPGAHTVVSGEHKLSLAEAQVFIFCSWYCKCSP